MEYGLKELGELIKLLADVPDKQLEEAYKAAKKVRARALMERIPKALKDSLLLKAEHLERGQTTTIAEERAAYKSFMKDRYHVRDVYGVEAWDLVAELRKPEVPTDEPSPNFCKGV